MEKEHIEIYTDGSCDANGKAKNHSGWAALISGNGSDYVVGGREFDSTCNRMEVLAAVKALESISNTSKKVVIYSDSIYLVNTMSRGWRRNANIDLWALLDAQVSRFSSVKFRWLRGHSGDPKNEMVDSLARAASKGRDVVEFYNSKFNIKKMQAPKTDNPTPRLNNNYKLIDSICSSVILRMRFCENQKELLEFIKDSTLKISKLCNQV